MSSTVKEIKEKTGYLKRSDLYTIGVGQAIGSGVLTLIGPAIPQDMIPNSVTDMLKNDKYQLLLVNSDL